MRVHGLAPRQGDTAYAFMVLRFARTLSRAALDEIIRHVAPISPEVESYLEDLESEGDAFRIIGMPWRPPEAGSDVELQRRLIEAAAGKGVDEAWFFQTGTSLPSIDVDDDDDEDDDEGGTQFDAEPLPDEDEDPGTQPIQIYPAAAPDDDDDEDDASWSHGPPPQTTKLRFPVDGYPQILEEHDWEDFGIAFKLGGSALAGEDTVLVGFHAMWLTPYGGRHRNTAVTIDHKHHAAHLWVDRFAVPVPVEEQVGFLLWIVSKLDEVIPVVHARFAEATMAQKYAEMLDPTAEPFVLGGNPLLEINARGGDDAVEEWITAQTVWSKEEVAQMLRQLAIELVTTSDDDEDTGDIEGVDEARSTMPVPIVEIDDEDVEAEEEDEEDSAEAEPDDDRGRYIAAYASRVLAARARAGRLDPRAADVLRPVLGEIEKYEHRRTAVTEILGAQRDRASVPALVQLIEATPIEGMLDSISKEKVLCAAAEALGAIGDPSALPVLATLLTRGDRHSDAPRPAAAHAIADLLSVTDAPRGLDDAAIAGLLESFTERQDDELSADLHFAFGRIARALSPGPRDQLRAKLAEGTSNSDEEDDDDAKFAKSVALVLAGAPRDAAAIATIRAGLHAGLTEPGWDNDATLRAVRFALRVGHELPDLVEPADLASLALFDEADIRESAHALATKLDAPFPIARQFDRAAREALSDTALVEAITAPAVIGRDQLIAQAASRDLAAAKPAIAQVANATLDGLHEDRPLDREKAVIEHAVKALRGGALSEETVALFDRILRHANSDVKWELLQDPPTDERLIPGMLFVLGQKWGWQERTARTWLAAKRGDPALEAALATSGLSLDGSDQEDDDEDDEAN